VLTLLAEPRISEHFDVAVACPEGDLAAAMRRAGIPVMLYPGADRSFSWAALSGLRHLMHTWRPQIAHTHGSLAGRVAASLSGARVVFTKHGLAGVDERAIQVRSPGALLKRASARLFADRIVAVSEAVKRALVAGGADPARVVVIPGGVALSEYAKAPTPVPGIIGTVGRLEREKGLDILVEAMAQLRGEARLLIGGDGQQREALAAQVRSLNVTDIVRLTGFVPDVATFLGQIGLFVLASRTEGLGIVLVEAMAAARPVVATRVGGIPEVVVDGETGLLVEPENPGALAGAIRRLLADPDLAARMGQAGRERARQVFSAGRMAELTAALYEELVRT
jgi:glycosyltransferase involved in cell wall biosynthesis